MLKEKLTADMKEAMKQKEVQKLSVIRMLLSAMKNKEIEKRSAGDATPLTDEEEQKVLAKEIKNRRKAIELFKQGGRQDLVDQNEKEITILEPYSASGM